MVAIICERQYRTAIVCSARWLACQAGCSSDRRCGIQSRRLLLRLAIVESSVQAGPVLPPDVSHAEG